jgi:hypothetical protein
MLLQLGNQLALELPDLLSVSLPKEGVPGNKTWCLVLQLEHGE